MSEPKAKRYDAPTAQNLIEVKLPDGIVTEGRVIPICIMCTDTDKEGTVWSFYAEDPSKAHSYGTPCPGCHGMAITMHAPALYCPWCATKLDPKDADDFGEVGG